MLGKTTTALLIASLSGCHPAFAEAPCEYDKTVETNWTQQIEKTSNIDKKVFPYVDDTRKCVMTMDVTIEGTTYPTEGNYVFGPDMTENDACEQATIKAKKKVIGEVSPEVLTARTEMNCSTKEELPVHAAAPQPEVTITESSPVITERIITEPVVTERIISRKVIDVTPSNVVQYIPNSNQGFTIGGITLSFDPHRNKRGKCYANWQTGGTDCY
tara:strand:- start:681 stop:1325 length:645 start_codon:yes stop_codon:yes gene_type:complete